MKYFKKFVFIIFILTVLTLPLFSFAQTPDTTSKVCGATVMTIGDVLCKIGSILKTIIPVMIVLGVVYFIWGIVTYVIASEEEAKQAGKMRMIYGIIGFVVIFALEGIVMIVINTFGFDPNSSILISNFVQNNTSIVATNTASCILSNSPKLGDLLNYATCLINSSIIPLIASLAVAMFIWGVVQYVINSDEEAKKQKGKEFMIWGIIGLVVMVGVWGLVKILGSTFGIEYAIPHLKQ